AKIVERKLVLLKFFKLRFGFRLVNFRLNLFNEREHVAHTKDSLRNPIWIERFERIILFAYAHELDGLACDLFYGKSSATARVAVHLRQHDARHSNATMKLFAR